MGGAATELPGDVSGCSLQNQNGPRRWATAVAEYAANYSLEMAAHVIELIALLLFSFALPFAILAVIVVCSGLLAISLMLHGAAHARGQNLVFPKTTEVSALIILLGLIPLAVCNPDAAQLWTFVVLNYAFAATQMVRSTSVQPCCCCGRARRPSMLLCVA
jgi:hypothetical protein